MSLRSRPLLVLLFLVSGACGGSNAGLRFTRIDSSVQRPSNVAVYFTVDTEAGEPVPGLNADQFQIYEDGQPISALESKQTILNPEVAATHYTLLLIDMSGSITESGDVPAVLQAAKSFAERVEKYQKVAVYAFDGSAAIHPIVGFSTGAALAGGIDRLESYKPRDPSTNLNGAIVEGLKVIRRQLRASTTPLTFGTLVVFTDGTDRAHRVPREQLHRELDASDVDLLVIGVGAEIDAGELSAIGRDGAIITTDRAEIASSFEQAAARVEAYSRRYYLLGYCSPSRAGKHQVTIAASVGGRSGSLTYDFDARGFGPGCDPDRPPSFNLKRPKAPKAPATQADEGRF